MKSCILLVLNLLSASVYTTRCDDVTQHWCFLNKTRSVKMVTQQQRNKSVNCLKLYKYVQDGWKYNEEDMTFKHGGLDGVTQYFREMDSEALCSVFIPKITKTTNVTKTVLGCCTGWGGRHCHIRKPQLGTCFYNDVCHTSDKTTSTTSDFHNVTSSTLPIQRTFTIEICCILLHGRSWKAMMSSLHHNRSSDTLCHLCNTTNALMYNTKKATAAEKHFCVAWGDGYYITFDKKFKKTSLRCAQRLAISTDLAWWIDIEYGECSDGLWCSHKLRVGFGDDVIFNFIEDDVFLNNELVSIDKEITKMGVLIKQTQHLTTVETSFGFKIKRIKKSLVVVIFNEYADVFKIQGLCRGETKMVSRKWLTEDFITPINVNPNDPQAGIKKHCNRNYAISDDIMCDRKSEKYKTFRTKCLSVLKDDSFKECRNIFSSQLFEICSLYVCKLASLPEEAIHSATCEVGTAYLLMCAAGGAKVLPWMSRYNCTWKCPKAMEFVECATKCQSSCNFPYDAVTSSQCYEDCSPGCQCPNGTVLSNQENVNDRSDLNACITPEACPCKHRNRYYNFGKKVMMDCNQCTCSGHGQWKCSTNRCHAVCHVISGSHVITFDGSKLTLSEKSCSRNILLESKRSASRFVEIETEMMTLVNGKNAGLVQIRQVRASIGEYKLSLKNDMKAYLNGTDTSLPYRHKDFSIRHSTTHSFIVETFGLYISWIPSTDSLKIILEPVFAGKVLGICGTFSWNSKDDFMLRDGDIEENPKMFIKKFQRKENGDRCVTSTKDTSLHANTSSFSPINPCMTHAYRYHYSRRMCNIIKRSYFQDCKSIVDATIYEEACRYDVCSSYDVTPKAACRSFSSYAHSCLQLLNDSDKMSDVISWRQDAELGGECELNCPSQLQRDECQPACSASCSDINKPLRSNLYISKSSTIYETELKCYPGCSCPPGMRMMSPSQAPSSQVLSFLQYEFFETTLTCVPKHLCSCYSGGKYFKAGESMESGCVICYCSAGRWNCSSSSCGTTLRCPHNMLFSRKVTPCDYATCENSDEIALMRDRGDCNMEFSYKGCVCPEGMLQQNNKCISRLDCPCRHGSKLYNKDETITRDCNTCSCQGGRWNCTNKLCSAVCVATGDPHYITFDGAKYSFQGLCGYTLVKENFNLFEISAENVPCGLSAVTCTKSIYITVGSTSVHLLRGKIITINGMRINKISRRYGNAINDDYNNVISIDIAGIYVIVSWPNIGLSVFWDGGTRIEIFLSSRHVGKVSGLCGNYDMTTANDFTTRQGSIEPTIISFVNSWKISSFCSEVSAVQDTAVLSPCEINFHRSAWGRQKCAIISTGRVFEQCRQLVPYVTYYNWCVYDACACDSGGDCECVCTAIAAYAQACNRNNVHVRWRSQQLCPMQCDNELVYLSCGPVCQETCKNNVSQLGEHCTNLPCVEGCFCPRDMVMHGQRCISKSDCPCYFEEGEFLPQATVIKDCQTCECSNGSWSCKGEVCDSLPPTCNDEEFLCFDQMYCISRQRLCNFERDCMDGSDEINCDWSAQECAEIGGYLCGDNKCLASKKRCDGKFDCEDESDEQDCSDESESDSTSCDGHLCVNGKCLINSSLCDGTNDCGFGDFSDEENCFRNCSLLQHHKCRNGTCISRFNYCDGDVDCEDKSDEVGCVCTLSYFTCVDGLCIDRVLFCDGEPDCSQGEDEINCTYTTPLPYSPEITLFFNITATPSDSNCSFKFYCDNDPANCLEWRLVCDGHNDCPDHSDELNCFRNCLEHQVHCDSGLTCLNITNLCDGLTECRDGSDEDDETCLSVSSSAIQTCQEFRCENGDCINKSLKCDGISHCSNGEDEIECRNATTTELKPTNISFSNQALCSGYTCLNEVCIELNQVCDEVDNCGDQMQNIFPISSDETGCASWSSWNEWSGCSKSCGSGEKSRERVCSIKKQDKSKNSIEYTDALRNNCKGKAAETLACFLKPCRTDNTVTLTQWSDWSDCSVTCGGGLTSRRRSCSDDLKSCSLLLNNGRYSPSVPLLEIQTCSPQTCPKKKCAGNQVFNNCKNSTIEDNEDCPVTCRDAFRSGSSLCVALKEEECKPGCGCPRHYLLINETSSQCVHVDNCPCFENGKMYDQGEEVKMKATCQICQCSREGKWRGCISDPSCDMAQLCGWAKWSNWGPCFGPCSVNGIQWAFRSSRQPSRYRIDRRCQGLYRKSRRCPTKKCNICDIFNQNGTIVSRKSGQRWIEDTCKICTCLENKTVVCEKYCQFSQTGCENNMTLIEDSNETSCCYCQQPKTTESLTLLPNTTSKISSTAFTFHENHTRNVQEYEKFPTPVSRLNNNSIFQFEASTPAYITNIPLCRGFICATAECINRSAVCDGSVDCRDGSDEKTQLCRNYLLNDDVQCSYSLWSDWSQCSLSCGLGQRIRIKKLKTPLSDKGNAEVQHCVALLEDTQPCFNNACQKDGGWSSWQEWSPCSDSCGGGVETRKRYCNKPWPLNGGRDCPGVSSETKVCNPTPCRFGLCFDGKIYLNGSKCSGFNPCFQTCEDLSDDVACKSKCEVSTRGACFCPQGKYLQDGKCVDREYCRCTLMHQSYLLGSVFKHKGCECECKNGKIHCSLNCTVNCLFSTWTEWSPCDRTCGGSGHTYRFRSPINSINSDQFKHKCKGIQKEQKTCLNKPCLPQWSTWTSWSLCSSSCGLGRQQRRRECLIEEDSTFEIFCEGSKFLPSYIQRRVCKNSSISSQCYSCSDHMTYSCVHCLRSCDSIINDANDTCVEECTWMCTCPDGKYMQGNKCVSLSNCSCDLKDYPNIPTRGIILPNSSFKLDCNTCSCFRGRISCTNLTCSKSFNSFWEWTKWSQWTECSHSCVNQHATEESIGTMRRYRQCLQRKDVPWVGNLSTSANCDGINEQTTQCGLNLCSYSSHWSDWATWSTCDRTCDQGIQTSTRLCRNENELTVESCKGPRYKVRACGLSSCKRNKCPPGSTFVQGCDLKCKKNPSCYDVSEEIKRTNTCDDFNEISCSEGYCQCRDTLLWQDGQCVKPDQCNCYVMEKIRKSGSNFSIGMCSTCFCNGGKVTCKPATDRNGNVLCDINQNCYDAKSHDVSWSAWTRCSKSCGVGVRRRFSISASNFLAIYVGAWCRHSNEEQEDCNISPCSLYEDLRVENSSLFNQSNSNLSDISWSSWSSWGACSATCTGDGFLSWRHRYRKCLHDDKRECFGSSSQTTTCDATILPLCNRNSTWSSWTPWSECPITCRSSLKNKTSVFRTRQRTCDKANSCTGLSSEAKLCKTEKVLSLCERNDEQPKDDASCQPVIAKSRYSECGPLCVNTCSGLKYCYESCVSGCFCTSDQVLTSNESACVEQWQCPCYHAKSATYYKPGEIFYNKSWCNQLCRCQNGIIHCEDCTSEEHLHRWSHWTTCTKTCGNENQLRFRSCIAGKGNPSSCGQSINISTETIMGVVSEKFQVQKRACKIYPVCPTHKNDSLAWEEWGKWSSCNCSSVHSMRRRICPSNFMKTKSCFGAVVQTRPCRRNITECGSTCSLGQLRSCQSHSCARTCLDLSPFVKCFDMIQSDTGSYSGQHQCVPQCVCPAGFLAHFTNQGREVKCVRSEDCPCYLPGVYMEDSGDFLNYDLEYFIQIRVNERWAANCKTCTCFPHGRLHCKFTNGSSCNHTESYYALWSMWSPWSQCSRTCKGGTQWRARLCRKEYSIPCYGAKEQERQCNSEVSCIFTSWKTWSTCSKTCGDEIRIRSRQCRPNHTCDESDLIEYTRCKNRKPCKYQLTSWSIWSQCSVTCGRGQQVRRRRCRNATHEIPFSHCAATTVTNTEITEGSETRNCVEKHCYSSVPTRHSWSSWSPWSLCHGECGVGYQHKNRTCLIELNYVLNNTTQKTCQGVTNVTRYCKLLPCPNMTSPRQCPMGMILRRSCDSCVKTESGWWNRLPQTCNELRSNTEGFSRSCEKEDCSPICVCPDDKLLQVNDEHEGDCVSAHDCECIDDGGGVWLPGARWKVASFTENNQICNSICMCSLGQVLCHNRECKSTESCGWNSWTVWTGCDFSCVDSATISRRYRFRSAKKDTERTQPCDGDTLQIDICKNIPPCHTCHGDDYFKKKWNPDACTECTCKYNRSVVCSNICWSQWSNWSDCSSDCGPDFFRTRKRICFRPQHCQLNESSVERERCRDVVATSYESFPKSNITSSTKNSNSTNVSACSSEMPCPAEICPDGYIKVREAGKRCPSCLPIDNSVEQFGSCSKHSEQKIFKMNGCKSKELKITYCAGNCFSATRVSALEPYFHSTCNCCMNKLDEVQPHLLVTLYCSNQSLKNISIPNVSSCSCSSCSGGRVFAAGAPP